MISKESVLAFFVLAPSLISGFVISPSRPIVSLQNKNEIQIMRNRHDDIVLFMSSEEGDTKTPKRRRKRKKKVQDPIEAEPVEAAEEPVEAARDPEIDLKIREAPVDLQVRDIREVVGGVVPGPVSSSPGETGVTAFTSSDAQSSATPSMPDPTSDDSFSSLLEDAKRMQAESSSVEEESEEGSIKAKVRNALSTIVTADFFVVCGFLLWFLAGIISRAVTDDASIQIAFNNNFELLVQPALGVLMLGTIAGQFLKDEEDE